MAALAEVVKKMAEKSGVDINTEEFKTVLEATSKIELPENTDLLSAYILKSDAKNDPEIKSHYYGMLANQFDDANLNAFSDLGLEKSILDEIRKTEPNSFKKITLLKEKMKEHVAKIADPSTLKGEKAELQKKLEALEAEKKQLIELAESEKSQLRQLNEQMQLDTFIEKNARDFKVIDIPYRETVVMQSISKSLADHEVKLVMKDGKPTLVNAKDPLLAPKDGITIKTIIEKGFANDKLLDLGTGKPDENQPDPTNPKQSSRVDLSNPKMSTIEKNLAIAKAAMAPVG